MTLRPYAARCSFVLALTAVGAVLYAGCGGSGGNANTGGDDAGGGTDAGGGDDATTMKAVCGDSVIEAPEECDLGSNNGKGQGCNNDCTWTCLATDPKRDCSSAGNPCTGTMTCGADHTCTAGTPLANGTMCATGKYCVNDNCNLPACGDGVVEPGEECDDGNSVNGDGCDNTCKFSCVSTDTTRNCASTNACVGNGTCNDTTHVCAAGTTKADGTSCGTNETCKSGVCTSALCGNGVIDPGEQCDPPNGTTCNANCQLIAICGDGTIEGTEQCDDGNTRNLDGCDSKCNYEAVARMTTVAIQGGGTAGPAFCVHPANALGNQALTSTAISSLNTTLATDTAAGTTNVMTQFVGLSDLTGVSATGFSVGVMSGSLDPAKGAWTGTSATNQPIDWWFLAAGSTVSNGLPTGLVMNGAIAARNLTAGPSNVSLTLNLGGSPALLEMLNAKIVATVNGTPAPNVPAPPPAKLASGLTVFQDITGNGTGQGLCGDITVESLAQIPIPQSLAQGGSNACGSCSGSHTYTYCGMGMPVSASCNSLLDAIVGGCKAVLCLVNAISPTQPDVAASGTVKTLALGTNNKVPTAQSSGDKDAYSSYIKFNGERAHFTSQTCTTNTDCQSGLTCQTGVCK